MFFTDVEYKAFLKLTHKKDRFLRLIFPRRCPMCGKIIAINDGIIHKRCFEEIKIVSMPICEKCGKQLFNYDDELCDDCKNTEHIFESGRFILEYKDKYKKSIIEYKNKNRREYADFFAVIIAIKYRNLIKQWNITDIVPVPLHKRRIKERGFDQNILLAKKICENLKKIGIEIKLNSELVTRKKYSSFQKYLTPMERKINIKNAITFNASYNKKIPENVLIIDDVYTTGATIDVVSIALKELGVKNVHFLCVSGGAN